MRIAHAIASDHFGSGLDSTIYCSDRNVEMTINDLMPKKVAFKLVAQTLGVSYNQIRDRVSKRPDFPKPRQQAGRAATYAKVDIEKWLGVK